MRLSSSTIRTRPLAALLCGSLLLSACGGNGSGNGGPTVSRPLGKEVACTLSLNPTSVAPGEPVTVTGIPANFSNPGMRVIARNASGDTVGAAFFEAPESGQASRFAAPLHPATPLAGGEVLIEIGDGARRCAALPLQIGGLPDAEPALMQTVLDKLETWLDLQIRVLGGDPAALAAADQDSIDPSLIPLSVAKKLLGSDQAPGSLRQQVTQAIASGDRIIPGVMVAADLAGELDRAIAELNALPPTLREPLTAAKNVRCEAERLTPVPLPIRSAAELSQRMLASGKGGLYQSNALGQFIGTVGIAASEEASSGGPFSGAGAASVGANALGAKLYVLKTVEAARQALEPKTIESFDLRRADTLLVEDRPASQPGRWENASVIAVGEEFNVNEAALDGLITTVGMIPGPVGATVGIGSTAFANPISAALKELTSEGCTRIEAPRYGPIDVTDEEWTESRIIGTAVQRIDHRTYRGAEIGSAELKVTLRGEKFNVLSAQFSETLNIVVNPQILSLLPSSLRLSEPGGLATIGATIANSEAGPNGPINIERQIVSSGDHEIRNVRANGDLLEIDVQASSRREDFPVRIRFAPLNPVLPGGGPRERIATIDIGGALTLDRNGGDCLLPNSEAQFTATLNGFAANELGVDLTVTGGTLVSHENNVATQRIVVRAGGPGTLTVRAVSRADRSLSEEISVPVLRTCLRKIHYSGGVFQAGGIGVDSDGSDGCPPESDVANQDTRTGPPEESIVIPPAIPPASDLWFQREERITADFTTDVTVHRLVDESCRSHRFSGRTEGDIRFYAEEDGTLGMQFNADLSGNCRVENDELAGCSRSQAAGVFNTMSYFEITEDTPIRIEGELRCAGLSGYVELTSFSGIATRFEDGVTPYLGIAEGHSLIVKPDGSQAVPVLWVAECTEADEVVPFAETVIFQAPRKAGGKDLIVVLGSGSASAQINGITKSGFGPLIDPENPQPPPLPQSGSYASKAQVDFRVKLAPQ